MNIYIYIKREGEREKERDVLVLFSVIPGRSPLWRGFSSLSVMLSVYSKPRRQDLQVLKMKYLLL